MYLKIEMSSIAYKPTRKYTQALAPTSITVQ